jgi:DNA-binding transcriptional regulator YbjK
MAINRVLDTESSLPYSNNLNPVYTRYVAQMNERTRLKHMIADAPTIEERKTGEWIELTNANHTYVCSECGRMLVNITDGKNMVTINYPFCHCGAKMES